MKGYLENMLIVFSCIIVPQRGMAVYPENMVLYFS